jgi:hypothetical protein
VLGLSAYFASIFLPEFKRGASFLYLRKPSLTCVLVLALF